MVVVGECFSFVFGGAWILRIVLDPFGSIWRSLKGFILRKEVMDTTHGWEVFLPNIAKYLRNAASRADSLSLMQSLIPYSFHHMERNSRKGLR